MAKKSRDEVLREVAERTNDIIRRNRRDERLVVALLVSQFLAGLALLTAGAALERWFLVVPGGLLSALLFWPVNRLIALRANNLRLQLLPELLRLADEERSQQLAAALVNRLIDKLELG